MSAMHDRPTAPFTVFHRAMTGEGGFSCRRCGVLRHGSFGRVSDAFAVATQHLLICRADLQGRLLEGTAILDGRTHAAILREGIMLVSLEPVFATGQSAVRLIA